jgi:hypothetical protein
VRAGDHVIVVIDGALVLRETSLCSTRWATCRLLSPSGGQRLFPSGQQALRAHLSDHHHQPGLRSPLGAANGDLRTSILAYRLQNKAKGTRLVPVLDDEMAHPTRLERVASTFGGQP